MLYGEAMNAAETVCRVAAPAKINLTLEVLGCRADGYHDIRSILVPVSLADDVELRESDGDRLEVVPDDVDTGAIGPAAENLALRAAGLLRRRAGLARRVAIRIVKRIPVGGGLGGGSADAAATLAGLNRLWGLDWPQARLMELAAELVQLSESAEAYGALGKAAKFQIVLIESGPRILASFPEEISAATQKRLAALGVTVLLNRKVQAAQADGLVLDGEELIPAGLSVWAAGVKAPAFLSTLGLPTTRGHQLIVNDDLQTADPHIYAVGDCASYTLPGESTPLPPTAQVAHQQARYVIELLPKVLDSTHAYAGKGFAYRDFGALVSLANYDAYGSLGKFGLFNGGLIKGRMAMLSHIWLYRSHQARLYGFWRGGLLWLVDLINSRLRPSIRLD